MDFPLKNMFDALKDEIWEELGPLDPDWFETLTSKQLISEENVSDQDDLCPNQEGHFKTPFNKNAVDSQLFSTPKAFRHCKTVSPGTEDEQSFNSDQEREALPWAGTQSPYLSQETKERFHGVKLCGLQYQSQDSFNLHNTPQKSDASYAKHISEALGADTHADVSWTSSLNTPTASTLILTKPNKSPCPVSVSEEQNVVIVRKLFPSLSNASEVGFLSPQKNSTTTVHQDAVACGGEDTLESLDSSKASLNQSECAWRHKLPDAIEEGDIRNTIASAIDGAEDVLSIFFTNSNSALRKAKTDRVKRKQKVVKKVGDPKFTVTSPTNTVLSAEQGPSSQERLASPPPLKAEDIGALQWSPLSLSEIPLSVADAICHDSAASQIETPKQLERSHLKVSQYACGSRKRKFVYSVETAKVQRQGGDTQKVGSSSGILQSGQDINSERVPDKGDCSASKNEAATLESQTKKENQHLPEQSKLQDLDISQLSRDFAQDFSHIPDPGKVAVVAKDSSWSGFSPSACLSAMKQAYRKVRQADLPADCNRSLTTTNPTTLVNESTILDSGFQSAVTDISHVTVSSTNLENIGQSLQPLDFKMDDSGTAASASLNKGAGEEHLHGLLQEVRADARLPEGLKETKMVTLNEESELLGESKSTRLLGNAKENADNGTDGLAHRRLAEKTAFSDPSAFASGFKTASRKEIHISSASLAKARHLFEETERENGFVPTTVECTKDQLEMSAESLKTAHSDRLLPSTENIVVNGVQLTASQKADVTELCTVLEEADSQFEFTQIRVAKTKQQDGATSAKEADKELDSDFLSGIDFDDSFSLDGGKNQTKSETNADITLNANVLKCDKVTSAKTSNLTSETADLLLPDAGRKEEPMAENASQHTSDSRYSVASDEAHNKDGQTATSTLGNDAALTLGVGFKTARGNVLSVSKKHLSKAKALFADLEGSVVAGEKFPTTVRNCDKTEISSSTGTTMCQGGFQMANGKASSLSAHTMRKAEAPFKANRPLKHEPGQKYQNVEEIKAQGTTRMFENWNAEPSTHTSSSNAINREKARMSAEAMTKVGHIEQIPQQAPENAGFYMASGKGVSVSSEALRKAKMLLSDCDKVRDENFSKQAPCEQSASEMPSANGGFLAASGKVVTVSFQALQKAKALFSDIGFTAEIPPTSLTTSDSKQQDVAENVKKTLCDFSVGAKPLKAQNPSNESSAGAQNILTAVDRLSAPSLKENQFAMQDPPLLCTPPESIDRPAVNELSDSGFDSASEKKAFLSDEATKAAKGPLFSGGTLEGRNKELKETDSFPPQKVGFQTASGKGVKISSAALKKAKTLLSECEGAKEEAVVKNSPFKKPIPGPAGKGCELITANEKTAAFSEASQDAHAHLGRRSSKSEITVVSNSWTSDYKGGSADTGILSCGFTTAGGTKVHVSQKNLLKAKKLLNDCNLGVRCENVGGSTFEQHESNTVKYSTAAPLKKTQPVLEEHAGPSTVSETSYRGGFSTASGSKIAVSSEAMAKAKVLLSSDAPFEGRHEEPKEKETFPPQNGGFQTASGKGVTISSAALKKAKALFSECEGAQEEISGKAPHFKKPAPVPNSRTRDHKEAPVTGGLDCGFTTAGGAKVNVSLKNLLKAKTLLSECNLGVTDADSSFKEHDIMAGVMAFQQQQIGTREEIHPKTNGGLCKNTQSGSNQTPVLLKEQSENIDCPLISQSGCGGGFNTASGKRVSVSTEAMTKAKALLKSNVTLGFPPQTGGFQTANGKGVAISSAALQKAKLLLSECEGLKEEVVVKGSPFKKPLPRLPVKNVERPAIGDKLVAFSEGLEDTRENKDSFCGSDKMHGGFMTAGGAKVNVSLKNLLKAKKLLSECNVGMTDAESSFKEHDVMAGSTFQQQPIGTREETDLKTNGQVSKNTQSGSKQTSVLMEEQSQIVDCPSISTLGSGGGFNTASGKRVSVSTEAMTKAKALLNSDVTHSFPPQTGGFLTASGKGVAISSVALQKAKLLFSECEGVKEEVGVKGSPFKKPIPSSAVRNGGHPATGDKLVAFSEGLEDTRENKDAFCGSDKMHGGFMTAGGAKVHVSQKNLLKAKNLLEDLADWDRYDEALDSRSPHGPRPSEPSAVKPAESSSNAAIWDKENSKGSVKVGESLLTLTDAGISERETAQNPSECAIKNKASTIGQDGPPEVSQLSDSLEEEMLSVLEYEMNQLGSEAAAEVEKPVQPSAMHLQSLNLTGCTETQQRFLAQEALDCTKALLEDEHLAVRRTSVTLNNSTHLHDHPKSGGDHFEEQKGRGKRTAEDPGANGQPPLKRRLLEEFDRTVVGPRGSVLEPEISSPNGLMKDRRAFRYSLSLQPNITGPHRNATKCFESSFPQTTPKERSGPADGKTAPSKTPTFVPPLCKNTSKETCQSATVKDSARTSAVFIPPFKKQRVVVQDSSSEAKREKEEGEDKRNCVSVTPVKIKSFVPPTEKSPSTRDAPDCKSKEDIQSVASADTSRTELEINQNLPVGGRSEESARETSSSFLPNIELARDMQDMRIRKKKRQTIRPLPGKLFQTKTSAASRIPLKAAGAGKTPARYARQQLYSHGVHPHAHEITSETAEAFRFSLKQFVQPEALMEAGGVQLADGGWLVPSEDSTAGKEEFYRSLCDTPGVDPKLISEEWVHNHYRWIVWKQASMERSFPETMGGRCLTPHQVLLQLKFRYDVEVDHSRRPALRKIMERDDTAAKTLVLCVCGVASRGSSPKAKTPGADAKVDSPFAVVWLTDGWYAIKAQLDEPLTAMLLKGRLAIGGKLITHGAQLVGSQDACSPLEAPESLMLKICANSSRPARWDSRLGFQRDPRPFLLPISSLYGSGGPVGCVDVVVLRSYPLQWMERKPDGGVVFRSVRAEEREERRYNMGKQKAMEAMFSKIQSEFEKEDKEKNKPQRRRRTVSRQDIASLQDGEELYEALGDDPAYLEAHLSVQQIETLHAYRRALVEKKQAEVQERYRRALEDAQDGEGGCPRRDVAPVWRLCVADSTQQPGSAYQMSLWRPPSDLQSLLKEGCRYKVYNLTTSDAKKPGGSTTVQLTGTKKTQFEHLQASQDWLSSRYQPRVSTDFVTLQNPEFQPLCGEVDLTGYVISIIDAQGPSPAFYLADGKLNFVKVRCFSSFAQSGLEDVVRPRALLALGNLQLRGQSIVPTPVIYAGDLTVFSTNPKEAHLQESLSQLRNLIQCQENFMPTAEEKLSCLIKSDGLSYITSPAQRAGTPACARDRRPDTKASVAFQQSVRNLGPCTPIGRKPLDTNSSAEKDPSSLKRRRALDYLSRIPSPPHLLLLNSTASPCIKKTFVPPRRSGTPCTLKPVQTPTPKPVSSPVEEEWVNDEELAMIDTQALRVGSSVCSRETV
ncbi:breast cancer type 2 susceptibility protein [Nelusetta ayraudi]|uniref:breast cancer type 2 susceptibility protein n=1 Tax=Nelusetta ayraudi TaxID=303726 RepID=UPI003F6FA33F